MKKKLFLLLLIGFMMPFSARALSGSVSLSCESTTLVSGSSTNCTLSGFSDVGISALSAKLSSSGGVSISNILTSSIWQGDGSGGSIDLYTDNNKSGNFSIATFTVSVRDEGSISVSGITFSDANFVENSVSSKSVNLKIKSEEIKDVNDNVNDTPSDLTNNNNINTNINTNVNNFIEEKKVSSDSNLKSLTLSSGNIDFSSNITDYIVEVPNEIESIEIIAEANHSKAIIDYPNNLLLELGDNRFTIVVTAEDGTKKQYNINVIRLEKVLSNDSSLLSLNIEGYDIDFLKDKFIYNLGNINSSSLKVNAKSSDSTASIKIYGNNSIGKNDSIIVEVTAEDGSKSQYIIYVNNLKSSNNVIFIFLLIIIIILVIFNIFLTIRYKRNRM